MISMGSIIHAVVRPGDESGYVADCHELPVVTQGATLDATIAGLREAIGLLFEDHAPADFGLSDHPSLSVVLEIAPLAHAG